MLKFASLFAFCAALFGAATVSTIAGPSDRSVLPQGSYQEAREWNDIVCCKVGEQTSFTTFGKCRGHHHGDGVVVNNAQCRHDANTSTDTLDSGVNDGRGHVCCEKAGHVWWAGKKECALRYGDIVSPRRCS